MKPLNSLLDLGNCSNLINWNDVIKQIEQHSEPGYIGPRQALDDPDVKEIADKWKQGGYDGAKRGGTAEWHMFFPDVHFDKTVVDVFLDFCKIKTYNSAWVSRIMPGYCAPTHRDLQVADTVNPLRIHCHIDTPEVGPVLIVANDYLYDQPQGQTYLWKDPLEWHSSFNLGLRPNYIFNLY